MLKQITMGIFTIFLLISETSEKLLRYLKTF